MSNDKTEERAAFEAHFFPAGVGPHTDGEGTYIGLHAQCMWEGWQARAAMSSRTVQGGAATKTEQRMQRTISRLQNQIKDLKSSRDYWQKQAALSSAPAREQWQPIETAPKDGRKLLLTYKNSAGLPRIVVGGWVTDEEAAETDEDGVGLEAGWYERIDNWGDYYQVSINEGEPTHWMPLPAAPGATAEPAPAREPMTDEQVEPMFRARKATPTKGIKDEWYWYSWGVEDSERHHGICKE